jgi:hypothetical protein
LPSFASTGNHIIFNRWRIVIYGLYSLWGRFSLRNQLSRTEYVREPARFVEILDDHRLIVQKIDLVGPKLAMMMYKPKNAFVTEHKATNVAISLFTTSAARLRLLEAMEKVVAQPHAELLYTDT